MLRWYWWRFNGWGYAAGTLLGLAAAVAVPLIPATLPMYVTFPSICAVSLAGSLIATWASRPTEDGTLISFFRSVRPLGAWEPIRRKTGLPVKELRRRSESSRLAVVNVVLAGVVVLGAYLFPMYLVGHWHARAAVCLGLASAAAVLLYFTWYRNLPAENS